MASFHSRWARSKFQLSRLRRLIFRNALVEGFTRNEKKRSLRFENLESRNLMAWISQGPAPGINGQEDVPPDDQINGAVQAIAVNPTNPNEMYVGSVNGGIWKSVNATAAAPHWTPLTDNLRSLSIGALEFDPTDASRQTLIAATGITSSFFLGDEFRGVLYSTNGGSSWTELGTTTLANQNLTSVAARGSTLLAASDNAWGGGLGNGLFRSTNGGTNWIQISGSNGLPVGDVSDIVSDPLNTNTFYAAVTGATGGVFRSTDTGLNWTNITNGIGIISGATNKIELGVHDNAGTVVVYAAVVNNSTLAGVFRSLNGAAFTALDIPAGGGQGFVHLSITAHPTDPNLVYVGGAAGTQYLSRINASAALGSQITALIGGTFGSPHVDTRELVFDAAGNLILGSDGGLFRLTTPSVNTGKWSAIVGDISIFETHSIAYDNVSNVLGAGAQDNGTLYQLSKDNPVWDHPGFGDGGDVAIDDVSLRGAGQSIRYRSSQNLGGWTRQVYDSNNVAVGAPVNLAFIADGQFVTPVVLNAVDPTRVLVAGGTNLYESFNRGSTLTNLGGPGANGSVGSPIVYGGYLAGVPNAEIIYAGDTNRVYLRTTAAGSITATSALPTGAGTVIDVTVNTDNWRNVFAIDSNQVFVSNDAGTTWRDITGDVLLKSQTGFHTLEFVPDATGGSILIGTNSGVFLSSAAGTGKWNKLGQDLPDVIVYDLEFDATDDVLAAGTMGRGAWLLPNAAAEIALATVGAEPPRLLSIAPNSGKLLDPNVGNAPTSNVLSEAPRELTFRFSGTQQLDPTTLQGIRITRSGGDDNFNSGNEVVVTPTFLGFGDSSRVVIARFGDALPDDQYKIEALAVSVNGLPALKSVGNQTLLPRFAGTDRDTYYMNLELGGKIVAVVPQPVIRQTNGVLTQERNKIEVYFNNDDLNLTLATKPEFYQLILTKDSVTPNDDTVFTPSSVSYDSTADKAVLTFASDIDILAGGSGTFRLRIGSNRTVATSLAPQSPTVSLIAADVGDTLASASTVLGTLGAPTSRLIDTNVTFTATNRLNLNYPGSIFEPGHRDNQDENHLLAGADSNPNITKILYNFADGRSYGNGSNGQPLFSSITSDQRQRIREIFEFYSAQAGIDVVETQAEGLTIVVGDLFPLNNPPAPFPPAGIAGGGLAIMNGALSWNNGLGESFFDVATHEIGHLLGLGHTYEQPSGTVQGSTGQLDSGNPIEFFFPGDIDVEHLQYIHRPDNRDVDIYQFNIPVGQKGKFVAETIAERLSDASELDTYLTLFKRDATGLHIIAVNDNYFSDDSLIRAEVTGEAGADYFIAVTSRGNENYDPKINGSGSGGTSQGRYQLRVDYLPSEVNQILDTSGTPLDGDGDGLAGGEFNFWFRAASPSGVASVGAPKTIFVDKDGTPVGANGSLSNPYLTIPSALAVALPGDIVRLVGSVGIDRNLATVSDNLAYEIGDGGPGKGVLSDGPDLTVPRGVTLMIDAGAILKIASTEILVGSSDASSNRSGATIQVLGTPSQGVVFSSYFDESFGVDTNLLATLPAPGNWGGIEIRNDADREQGRREPELDGIFLNYIAQADIRYGGGTVGQGSQGRVVNPIHLSSSRPTLLYNRISQSADAGISADPNSFEETLFTESRYQFAAPFTPDYSRVGPDIRGQQITDSSTNGLSIRIDTLAGQKLKSLNVAARLDDTDIVYALGENLVIEGTPGGSFKETIGPNLASISRSVSLGGSLVASTTYDYRMTFIDRNGNEGLPSPLTVSLTTTALNRSIVLGNLPQATNDFVGRRLYRKIATSTKWDLVAELDRIGSSYTDNGTSRLLASNVTLTSAISLQRARRDASLVIDPGVVIKLQGSRIEVGIGAQLIAEGTSSKPIIFTSRKDDRFGAGATFDTNNDDTNLLGESTPTAGDWSGIYASHLSTISIDSALITFGGGSSNIANGSATFSAVEVNQATARIANSILENNAAGSTQAGSFNRDYHGPTDASVIHVVASQPVIFNNTIRNNSASAAISIDANSMKAISVRDYGRSTGTNQRTELSTGNLGPFVLGNELGGNALNGMRVRGATLTTETVWDDTDIVHILQSQIVIPDFHTYGGLRLQSKVDESLVVKLNGVNAGITASGRPLDIPARIGGSLQIIGAPGFPVVLTSISDDSSGAGFDWEGRPMLDTNNDGVSTGTAGDWRSIRLNPYSNDRNLDTLQELESDPVGDRNRNDLPAAAQNIGLLASNLNGGDENIRLGFTIHGTIASATDLDVYSFIATAGTSVWFDIDRSGAALDSVIELIDPTGQIIAQSDNSYNESSAGSVYSNNASFVLTGGRALPMNQSSFVTATTDFQTINPLDAGLRIQLPGAQGTSNKYLIRVRSSNLAPGDASSKLQDLSQTSSGLSVGPYRLQIRLQQEDEVAGSTVRFADIRYATTGIEVLGLPGHSPLTSELGEVETNSTDPLTAQNLGNIANSDRSGISVAGQLGSVTDVDWYRFQVTRDSIQSPGGVPLGTVIDVDYADGLGRPDATLWVYRLVGNVPQLVLIGTDSNIADDRAAPSTGTGANDLTRGSFGPRDPFIGVQELPDGEYIIGITPSSRVEQQFRQFSQAAATNPLFRVEPISSLQRIADDHFEGSNFPVPDPFAFPPVVVAKQVAFAGNANAVPLNLSDVTLFVSQTDQRAAGNRSRLLYANPLTGVREAELAQGLNFPLVHDIAVSPAGSVVGAEVQPGGNLTDANTGFLTRLNHDGSAQTRVNAGMNTFEAYATAAVPPVFSVTQARNGATTNGVGTFFTALSFAENTTNQSLALFGIAQRANRQPFDQAVLGTIPPATAIVQVGVLPGDPISTPYKNILYRVNPDTLLAISPPNAPSRTGIRTARGTGTDVREYGVFAEVSTYNWDTGNNLFGDNIVVTRQANGDIVGLAEVNGFLYGVTGLGELWRMPMGDFNDGFERGATLISTTLPVGLTGLAKGPRNVEGGAFANLLFGVTATGQIHAFSSGGVGVGGTPQPIFPGAASSVIAPNAADGLGIVNGIDFGALDVNLWHTSNIRGGDAGHGRPANFDSSRAGNQAGNNSLYFGYEPTGGNAIAGNWTGIYAPAAATGTYNFAGGAAGAVESNPIDLRSYSVDDKPMLYFTYRADTENSNVPNTGNNPMLDAFRVYGVTPDGTSILLATNNAADNGNYADGNNEVDDDISGNADAFGVAYKPQILFDALEAGDTGGWRQARVPLAALAGLNDIKLRFEFSSGGSFRSGDPLRGGVDLTVVPGSQINDGETFTITGPGPTGATITNTFEFDLGLVLNLPSGASILAGNQLTVQGRVFTFRNSATGTLPIVFAATDSPAQIAVAVAAALTADGFSVSTNATSPNILNVNRGTRIVTTAGPHSVTGLDNGIIVGRPGVFGLNTPVPINQSMTAAAVRDAIRQRLATTFNITGQAANINAWKFNNNTLRLYNYTVVSAGPLVLTAQRPGDLFGPRPNAGDPTTFAQASLRATNNVNEGIFVDDIVIGLAERGEMVVGATALTPVYQNDPLLTDGGFVSPSPTPSGTYQVEIRTAAEYLTPPFLGRTFDSNDRLAEQLALVVSGPGTFRDGATFTLSDGVNQFTFEFDITTSNTDRAFGVIGGNVAVAVSPAATSGEIAEAIRDAINSPSVQSSFKLTASLNGEVPDGAGGYINPDLSNVIQLHGQAAADSRGSLATNLTGLALRQFGVTNSGFGEDLGDSNRRRDQGQVVISSNTVRNSSTFGIVVDNAPRDQSPGLADFVGDRPYPGSVRNLITDNTSDLAPGVVVSNNIVASNTTGGIRISGDNTAGVSTAASNIARVFNNTVYGTRSNDTGILVDERANATILNNVLANLTTGINIASPLGFNSQSVLGSNIYQSNVTNTVGTGLGNNSIVLVATDPLFVNTLNNRFYLAAQSRAIDSSNSSLAEIGLLSQVKNSVLLPASPLLAPDRDVTGVLRVDDISVPSTGQGPNINIDRGAVERGDTVRLKAFLVNPLDNDAANVDVDRNSTYVQLPANLIANLDAFSILLTDDLGSCPDATTVLPESVIVTENGKQLVEGIDYVFGYNAGSNTIRLTPLAGLWRRDSVYEISLINKPTYRIDTGNGSKISDGDLYTATLPDGTTRILEYDSGFVLNVPSTLTPALADGQTISYQKVGGPTTTFEFNLVGDPNFNVNNTMITLAATDTFLIIASKIETALASVATGGNYPVKDLGLGRVHVGGALGDLLQVSNAFIALTGKPGVAPSITIQTPLNGGAGIADGQLFSIKVNAGLPVVFEFDNNSATTFGNRVIGFTALDTNDSLATKIATSIANAGLGFTPTTSAGGIVKLNEPRGAVLNLLTANLTSTGIPGGAIAIPYIPSSTFTASQIAIQTIKAINQIGQGVKVFSIGSGGILIEGLSGLVGANLSTPVVIRDIAGNPLNANRSNALTQFTIVMPDVLFDFGDAPGVNAQTLLSNNGARHAILPPDADKIYLGASVDSESDGQPNANATGDDLDIGKIIKLPDDEDGVRVSGFFNARNGLVSPVPAIPVQTTVIPNTTVTITLSGIGFVDAWIDWNRDGDFTDGGEQVITNQVVTAGDSIFSVMTPPTASVGLSFIRVRLSTLGNLLSGGVGIGGEVEDHQIEIINNYTPVAIDDSYTTTEDIPLNRNAATGILFNDVDGDLGAVLTVVDSDATTAGIQPIVVPQHGTLALNANGSFIYTPNSNYAGADSFVYFISDSVLTSLRPATVFITVMPVNDPPTFTIPVSIAVIEDQGSTVDVNGNQIQVPISIASFATTILPGGVNAVDENGQILTFNVVARRPSFFEVQPTIAINPGNPSVATLTFTLAKNVNRDFVNGLNNLVDVTLSDNGIPIATSPSVSFSINIAAVNDPPIPDGYAATIDEDITTSFTALSVLVGDLPGPLSATDEQPPSQVVSMVGIALVSAKGGIVTPFFNGLDINTFNYTPPANFNGSDTITYTISDNFGASPLTAVGTITITVNAINDAPIFSIPALINVVEDQGSIITNGGQTQVAISLSAFATAINPAPVGSLDEAGQTVSFDVIALQPSFFQVQPILVVNPSNPTEATLIFTLAPHVNNDFPNGPNNLVTIVARDNGPTGGSNVNASAPKTFSINITQVNDPPIPGAFLATAAEDSTTIFTTPQVLSVALPGPTAAIDEASSQTLTITQIGSSSTLGGVVTPVINAGVITSFSYVPPANFVGTDTITYTVTDNGVNPLSTVGTMTITLTAVNDAPQFSSGPNVAVLEDSAAYSQRWIPLDTSVPPRPLILAGPVNALDELNGSQSVSFEVAVDKPQLFLLPPAVDPNGVLMFTPAKDATGFAVITVTALDSGSNVFPNENRSQPATFTITLNAVNDEPIFTTGGDITVDEDFGAYNQSWATDIFQAAGLGLLPATATDESSQTISFVFLSNSNPTLFSAGPTIAADGSLRFIPALNRNGSAILTVVARDSGDSTAPNDNESSVKTFTINVSPVNDAPTGVDDNYTTTEDAPLISTTTDVTDNDFDVDGDTFVVLGGNKTSARGGAVRLNADGSFDYDPRSVAELQALRVGQTLTDTFTYQLRDANNVLSLLTTVTITVEGRNDNPVAVNDNYSVAEDNSLVVNGLGIIGNDTDVDVGSTLSVVDSDASKAGLQPSVLPKFGTLVLNPNGSFGYTPDLNFNGTDFFIYFVSDSQLTSLTPATVSINVTAVNDRPVFTSAGNISVDEDSGEFRLGWASGILPAVGLVSSPQTAIDEATQTVTFAVLSNSNPTFFSSAPAVSSNGELSFTPALNKNGSAIITVVARDNGLSLSPNQNESTVVTFTINILPINDPPIGISDNYSTNEDTVLTAGSLLVSQNDSDPEGDSFTIIPGSTTTQLGVTVQLNANGSFEYDPRNASTLQALVAGQSRTDTFTYRLQDSFGAASDLVTVTITVDGRNDNPIAVNDAYSINEDSTLVVSNSGLLANDTDLDAGGILSVVDGDTNILGTQPSVTPQFGTLLLNANGTFSYSPNANFVGTDTFAYLVSDGAFVSLIPATVTITVNPVNDEPVFTAGGNIAVNEDLGVFDQTWATGIRPASGLAAVPQTALDEATQSISFVFLSNSNPTLFSVTPSIASDGKLSFTSASNKNGIAIVTVVARDNGLATSPNDNESDTKTFTISVLPVNDAPIGVSDSYATDEDTPPTTISNPITANDFDLEGDTFTVIAGTTTSSLGVQVQLNADGTFGYDPRTSLTLQSLLPGESRSDTFTYRLRDSIGDSSGPITVTVTVSGRNDNPLPANDTFSTNEESSFAVSAPGILENDVDFDAGSVLSVVDSDLTKPGIQASVLPKFGSLVLNSNGAFSYTPNANFAGTDTFAYFVSDSVLSSLVPATVTIIVNPVNDEPIFASGGNITVNEDSGNFSQAWATGILPAVGLTAVPPISVEESSQSISFSVVSNSNPTLFSAGPAVAPDGKLSFTPALNKNGLAVVTVVARDNGLSTSPNDNESEIKTFTISILPVNDPPIGVSDSYTTNEDEVLIEITNVVSINDSDPDGDAFSVIAGSRTSARGVTVILKADGSFEYDPRFVPAMQALLTGQSLTDTFTYQLQDAPGTQSPLVTVTVTLDGRNDIPIALDDQFLVGPTAATNLNVLFNDLDLDSAFDFASLQISGLPSNGTASKLANGQISYTPKPNFQGTDSFKYRISDTSGNASNEAIVTIQINSAPFAKADTVSVSTNGNIVINVLANDSDADGNDTINASSVTIITQPTSGIATVQTNGSIRYIPVSNFVGTVAFTYSVADVNQVVSPIPGLVTVNVVTSLYQNPRNQFDVNNDGVVSPIDALIVINDIQRRGNRILAPGDYIPPPFIDVNGSGSVEPIDVLQVINYINRQSRGPSGEGESGRTGMAAPTPTISPAITPSNALQEAPPEASRTKTERVRDVAQVAVVDAAILAWAITGSQESLVHTTVDAASPRKRIQQTDAVFSNSLEAIWEG